MNKKVKHGTLLTVIFTLLSLLYLYLERCFTDIDFFLKGVDKYQYDRIQIQQADSGIWMEFIYHNLICSSDYLMLLHVCMVYLPREDKIYKDPLHALPVCNDRAIPNA